MLQSRSRIGRTGSTCQYLHGMMTWDDTKRDNNIHCGALIGENGPRFMTSYHAPLRSVGAVSTGQHDSVRRITRVEM
jgi:hypothetical protein